MTENNPEQDQATEQASDQLAPTDPAEHVGEQPVEPGLNPVREPLGTSQKFDAPAERSQLASKDEDVIRERIAASAVDASGSEPQPKAEDELRDQLDQAAQPDDSGSEPQPKAQDEQESASKPGELVERSVGADELVAQQPAGGELVETTTDDGQLADTAQPTNPETT